MKKIHVTGAELAPNGELMFRTVTETRRWWQRRTRYSAAVYGGAPGHWTDRRGHRPGKAMFRELDRVARALIEGAAPEVPFDRASIARLATGNASEVSRPSAR